MQEIMNEVKTNMNISGLGEITQKRYTYSITKFLKFVETTNKKIDLDSVKKFITYLKDEKKLSKGTINDYRSAIKYLFEVIIDVGWNDRKVPRLKEYKPLPRVLSKKETLKILQETENILMKTILTTIYSSGLRISEALNIRAGDVDSERMQIYIRKSKSGKARYAVLSETNLTLLRVYFKRYWKKKHGKWEKDDYLFCAKKKDVPVTKKTVRTELKRTAEITGIQKEMTPHILRHSFAVHLLESGVNLLVIKELLGHKSIISTCIYLQLIDIKVAGGKSPLDDM